MTMTLDPVRPVRADDATATLVNATAVLPDTVVEGTTIAVEDGKIATIGAEVGRASTVMDCEGDLVIPGVIDIHTDSLEKHVVPRAGVMWDGVAAALAHDAQIIGAGITTVFDALSLAGGRDRNDRKQILPLMVDGLDRARAAGLLRADHRLHLRCEVTEPTMLELIDPHLTNPSVQFLSVMDHTPGQRQYRSVDRWRSVYQAMERLSDTQIEALLQARLSAQETHAPAHQAAVAKMGQTLGLPIASHDDETEDHIAEALRLGITITEFPVTMEAAQAARAGGMTIVMGAPNLVRGGSHSGNVGAGELAQAGLLDVMASDYVPISLLPAAMMLAEPPFEWSLPQAIATVTANAADASLMSDRGRIAAGKRADLARVARLPTLPPSVRMAWRAGKRVA